MTDEKRTRALVAAVQLPEVDDAEHEASLLEIERLATTLGLEVVGRVTQRRSRVDPAVVFGRGKLEELAKRTGGTGVVPTGAKRRARKIDEPDAKGDRDDAAPDGAEAPDVSVVLVDHDLSPSQARNLERATRAEVLDRTSVILAIFQRHARTREAKVQVEIARLAYDAPRLREAGGGADRQRGGIGGKGAGESGLELDRRRIRDRIAELRQELKSIEREAGVRRARRSETPTVALVGYTNAGKSSWMRVLTGGEVLVADALFATLDTTVRALVPVTQPPILVSDTVGFIKKLPHDLVASFRSTLEAAREASLLLHVLDAADPAFRDQLAVTRQVLADLEADDAPSLLVLNKIDCVGEADREALAAEFPDAMQVSARSADDVLAVRARIVAHFEREMSDEEVFVSWSRQEVVAVVHANARVLVRAHEAEGTRYTLRASPAALARIRSLLTG